MFFFYIPAFVSTPTSVNAVLGSTATFNCSATTGFVSWIVNGTPFTQLNTPNITTTNNGRTLHVKAKKEFNNTNVTCAVLTLDHRESDDLFSDPAYLRVQGTLYFGYAKMFFYSKI